LHGFSDSLVGFRGEPIVGVPGIGEPDLQSSLVGSPDHIPTQKLLNHFLGVKLFLGVDPKYLGEVTERVGEIVLEFNEPLEATLDLEPILEEHPFGVGQLYFDLFG